MKIDKVVDFRKVEKACTTRMNKALSKYLRKNDETMVRHNYRKAIDKIAYQGRELKTYEYDLYWRHLKIKDRAKEMTMEEARVENLKIKGESKIYKMRTY